MNRYPSYKHSGVEWIGEIPEKWQIKKLRYLGASIIGITYSPDEVTNDESDHLVLRSSNIQEGVITLGDNVYVKKSIREDLLTRENDVLLCARNGSAHLVGKSALIMKHHVGLTFGAFMTVFRSPYGKFLYHFFNSNLFKAQTGLFATSTINQLTSSTLNNMEIALPIDANEQTAIANFLAKKTKEIDLLIAKKQKLIDLLKEERTAIINKAVTKGIDPNVKLKPSGIDWLGEIPTHWEVKKLKHLTTKVGSGITPTGGASVYQQDGVPLLRSQNIYSEGLILEDMAFISDEIDREMSNSRISEGDVLLNITGASIGRCYFVPKGFGKGNVNQHVCIIRPIQTKILVEFLHLVIISAYGQHMIDNCQNGANREGLNFQHIKSFDIPLPSITEQESIVNSIQEFNSRTFEVISKVDKEILLLQEYRTALISEVVTGKIKVI